MIKRILKKIIIFLLRLEARLILKRFKPKIIAVTGTVGKTSTKDAIYTVISKELRVRKSEKSYNSEFGVPLTIIGGKSGWNNPLLWITTLIRGVKLIITKQDYPDWLILEMGVDRPRDMRKLVSLIKPDIAIVTALGETPVHIEYFRDAEHMTREKGRLIQSVKKGGFVILNGDDTNVVELKEKSKVDVRTYGFSEGMDLTASNYHIVFHKEEEEEIPEGITFKIDFKGSIIPVWLYEVFGQQAVYPALAALSVSNILNLNMISSVESLSQYKSPPGRLKLLEGIKNTYILDDSYNSSPAAAKAAFEVLSDLPAKRKVAVLGDMLELGKYTIDEHKKVGREVKKIADLLFVIGPRSKFTAEEARNEGFKEKNIFEFSTSEEAKKIVQEKIKKGDLILIKGSQGMRMEKITEEIMLHPENKEELLVRQEREWQSK